MTTNWLLYKLFFFFFKCHHVPSHTSSTTWRLLTVYPFWFLLNKHALSQLCDSVNPSVQLVKQNPHGKGKPSVNPPCHLHPTKTKTMVMICALVETQTPILLLNNDNNKKQQQKKPHFEMSYSGAGVTSYAPLKESHIQIISWFTKIMCSTAGEGPDRQADTATLYLQQ